MNTTREKVTFFSLLVMNPILIVLLTDVSLSKDNKPEAVAQLQTNVVLAQRGPASVESAFVPEIPARTSRPSWSSPMAFDYSARKILEPGKKASPDVSSDSENK
jgi:hypothetical protein